ncbi:MAG: sulfite exporter TauE/SafE family protein [Deltaproteobacteria bacterium]|nr:sulfite exporter TauE/SafE family protein [Deltaproteobacteria bacterium]
MLAEAALTELPLWAGLALLALAGAVAAVINTMAGGGSLLTIPVLIGLGLPPGLANGTLRVGVAVQNAASVITFHRRGVRAYRPFLRLVVPMVVGAAGGTALATRLPDDSLRIVFGVMLAAWAVVLVLRPGRFLESPTEPRPVGWLALVLSALIGIYGGFLQAGVGFPLLALLVTYLGHEAVVANAIKMMLVLAYTAISLPMFALAGQVAWREGLALAAGAMVGGWLGTRLQLRVGAKLVRWVVVIAVGISGIAMLRGALG